MTRLQVGDRVTRWLPADGGRWDWDEAKMQGYPTYIGTVIEITNWVDYPYRVQWEIDPESWNDYREGDLRLLAPNPGCPCGICQGTV